MPHRLLDAAAPVIDRLASQLTDTSATILLADRDARIVQRWACRSFLPTLDRFNVAPGFTFAEHVVGTNGIGCAVEGKRLFEVRGPEHFRECLQSLVCVAAPIVVPTTNVAQGAINVTCDIAEANGLLRPLVQQALADIERRLLDAASLRERMVLDAFLSKARGATHPVLAVASGMVMASPTADGVVSAADRIVLWHWAQDALQHRAQASRPFETVDDMPYLVVATRIGEGRTPIGAVLEFRPADVDPAPRSIAAFDRFAAVLVGRSPATRRLRRAASAAAADAAPTIVIGPRGAGRLFVAVAISKSGANPDAAPLIIDSVPDDMDGLFESTARRNGTVIARGLDGWVPAVAEHLVVRSIAHGVRLIATSTDPPRNTDLVQRFIHRVDVPDLISRADDIPDLVALLLRELTNTIHRRVRPSTLDALMRHEWLGNICELKSVLAAAVASAGDGEIAEFHLPAWFRAADEGPHLTSIELAERNAILRSLSDHDGNKVATAAALGLARSTLYRKIRAYHIEPG